MTIESTVERANELQAIIAAGEAAKVERDRVMFALWKDYGFTQSQIARILNVADRRAGGRGVTATQVQKALQRLREQMEQTLIQQARRTS